MHGFDMITQKFTEAKCFWEENIWEDYKLKWDPREYGGIKDLHFPGDNSRIWRPDILLYNSADDNFDSTFKSNLLVYSTGEVNWIPPGILKFSCKLDITWFPFDDQICGLKNNYTRLMTNS
ncbi:unnamed protein product [Onchocerca flexuosa]|uniref:Neur_chan_LBD domain-containing protein n=1 Tax=Onchocerca flexuosa TaxID=387005 RepID=A0A183HRE7_9BILA|nr:unnamed protein product [Onchocerca flexuosa]